MYTHHLSLLLGLEFLVQLSQARSSVVVRVGGGRRAAAKARAKVRRSRAFLDHFAGSWYRRVVELEVEQHVGSSTAGGHGGANLASEGA